MTHFLRLKNNLGWELHRTQKYPDLWITIAHLDNDKYATWAMSPLGDTYCGHYFQEFLPALNDYLDRIKL